MKVIVARCADVERDDFQLLSEKLHEFLKGNGMAVQQLDLPPLDEDHGGLRSLVSYRLLPLAGMADALLCLDAHAAVLRHPRKCLWLLAAADAIAVSPRNDSFVANVLRAGVHEASELFAPSAVVRQLRETGWKRFNRLDPAPQKTRRNSRTNSRGRQVEPWAQLLQALRP